MPHLLRDAVLNSSDFRNICWAIIVLLTARASVVADDPKPRTVPGDAQRLTGLWSGAWGGGIGGEVVIQPVLAELLVRGDQIEMAGFPQINKLTGSLRVDHEQKRLVVTASDKALPEGVSPVKFEYRYEVDGNKLTLTDRDGLAIELHRLQLAQRGLANLKIELVEANGFDEQKNLLISVYNVLKAGKDELEYLEPVTQVVKTEQATILLVKEKECQQITLEEARTLIGKSMPVAVTYPLGGLQPPIGGNELWKNLGSPHPDSASAWNMFSKTLRPGTVVFIVRISDMFPEP